MVVGVNDRLERAQPDVIAAALIAQNVAPAADLDSPALQAFPVATRPRAAHHQNLRHVLPRPSVLCGDKRGFQIIGSVAPDSRPDLRSRRPDSLEVLLRPRAGQPNPQRIDRKSTRL